MYDLGFEDESLLRHKGVNWRGILTLSGLLITIGGILTLFVFYPIFAHFNGEGVRSAIVGNTRVNGSGQVADL